jgi:hypothetical protein
MERACSLPDTIGVCRRDEAGSPMSAITRWIGRALRRELRRFDSEQGFSQLARAQLRLELDKTPRFQDDKRLLKHEHQVFSQGGEDGALREIFRRIGTTSKTFVEFGVGDGLENNTAFLLQQGWSGVWLEGDAGNAQKIQSAMAREIADRRLVFVHRMLSVDNALASVAESVRSAPFDLLSIDLDRNTPHIWKALAALQPRVVVIEYNAVWPADMDYCVAYDAARHWNGSSHFGASLKALESIGRGIGFALVGCDCAGANAYFVRAELCADHFRAPFTAENHYEPIRYYLHGKTGHPRSFDG